MEASPQISGSLAQVEQSAQEAKVLAETASSTAQASAAAVLAATEAAATARAHFSSAQADAATAERKLCANLSDPDREAAKLESQTARQAADKAEKTSQAANDAKLEAAQKATQDDLNAKKVVRKAEVAADAAKRLADQEEKRADKEKVAADNKAARQKAVDADRTAKADAKRKEDADTAAKKLQSDIIEKESSEITLPGAPVRWPAIQSKLWNTTMALVADHTARGYLVKAGAMAVVVDRNTISLVSGTGDSVISICPSNQPPPQSKTLLLCAIAAYDRVQDVGTEECHDAAQYACLGDSGRFEKSLQTRNSVIRISEDISRITILLALKEKTRVAAEGPPAKCILFAPSIVRSDDSMDPIALAIMFYLWSHMAAGELSMESPAPVVNSLALVFGQGTPEVWSKNLLDDRSAPAVIAATATAATATDANATAATAATATAADNVDCVMSLPIGQNLVFFVAGHGDGRASQLLNIAIGQPHHTAFLSQEIVQFGGVPVETPEGSGSSTALSGRSVYVQWGSSTFRTIVRPVQQPAEVPVERLPEQSPVIPVAGVNAAVAQVRTSLTQHTKNCDLYQVGIGQIAVNLVRLIFEVYSAAYNNTGSGTENWGAFRAIPVTLPVKSMKKGPLQYFMEAILAKMCATLVPNSKDAAAFSAVSEESQETVTRYALTFLETLIQACSDLHPHVIQGAAAGDGSEWNLGTVEEIVANEWRFVRSLARSGQSASVSMVARMPDGRRAGALAYISTLGLYLESLYPILNFGLLLILQPQYALTEYVIEYRTRRKRERQIVAKRVSIDDLIGGASSYLQKNMCVSGPCGADVITNDAMSGLVSADAMFGRSGDFRMVPGSPVPAEASCAFLRSCVITDVFVVDTVTPVDNDGCSLQFQTSGVLHKVRLIGISDKSNPPGASLAAVLSESKSTDIERRLVVFTVRGIFSRERQPAKEFAFVARVGDDSRLLSVADTCSSAKNAGVSMLLSELPPWLASISVQARMVRADLASILEVTDLQFPIPALTFARLQVQRKRGSSGWQRGTTIFL